jgi:NADPH-dependent glutamate synthase beta subunit-like oxidoreductase/2,4-dienoyl-CoA reductase-like NADH-dependent reductase (Old Yellow Enzyme family)
MRLSIFEQFHLETPKELYDKARRLKLQVPVADTVTALGEPVVLSDWKIPNRLCVQPMEGCDAGIGGVPGELTLRRYRRYAEGGFGLIWVEATAVDGQCRSNPRQLWMNHRNLKAFADLVRDIKQAARHRWGHDIIVILQLAHAGRYSNSEGVADPMIAHHDPDLDRRLGLPADYPVVSDEYLDRLQELYAIAGCLAAEAGFDGVDLKACHGDLSAELLAASTRPGRYGGSFENRSRFLRETTGKLKTNLPGYLLASRITAYDGVRFPFGFGTDRMDSRKVDSSEPVALARALQEAGTRLLSISDGNSSGRMPGEDHPLARFARLFEITKAIQQAVPATPVVGGGFSWFRHLLPNVAAGALREGGGSLIGIGRAALAYPDLAGDLIQTGHLDPDKCCMTCSACIQLVKDGGNAGCAIMDGDIYGAEYRHRRHFALDNLKEDARRCLGCEPAPCQVGCPARIDVPAFLKAFAADDVKTAYEIIRKSNALPGMCAHLCPVDRMCEGRCVTNTLEGTPISIHDIQYVVSWIARQQGFTGVRIPQVDTEKRIAVIGGGPAGIACAITLLERGHHVVLFERAARLGGTPEQVIRSSRYTGAQEEIEAILQPALSEARLRLRFGCELGRGISLETVRRDHDAVFLAAGVWGEHSLGRPDGVVDGVGFLRKTRAREIRTVPPRVILLAGGDSAMDSAMVARELGARELTIVYAGALSEMHWHMPDSWFRTEGVHFMTLTRPIGYQVEADGKVSGLRIRMNSGSPEAAYPGPEYVLEATLIIEAMGLGLEKSLTAALQGCQFSEEGLVKTPNGSSLSTGLSGIYAGGGVINGGASVVQCVAEGMRAGREIDVFLKKNAGKHETGKL